MHQFFLDKSDVPEQTAPAVSKKELLTVFSFLGNYSMNLKARLYKSLSKTLVQCNIKVIFQSENRLSSYFKFKDSIFLYFITTLFTTFGVIIAILVTNRKLNVILKLKLVGI